MLGGRRGCLMGSGVACARESESFIAGAAHRQIDGKTRIALAGRPGDSIHWQGGAMLDWAEAARMLRHHLMRSLVPACFTSNNQFDLSFLKLSSSDQ